jgi:predicted dienelactone hydrolase
MAVFSFPPPTGPHAIGTVARHWVDAQRPEVFTDDRAARRELMVQISYPATDQPTAPRARYLPDAALVAPALARFLGEPEETLLPLADVTTNAVEAAPMADDDAPYPVLIMLVGIKGSYRQIQTFQVEELVSHGYVVVAVDQPYAEAVVAFPDGRTTAYDERLNPPRSQFMDDHIPYLAGDASFALDRLAALGRGDAGTTDDDRMFAGRLDLDRAGLVGHSFGAVVGSEACRVDGRLRAALLEEGFMPADVVRDGLRQPTMFLTRDAESMRLERRLAGGWPESDIRDTRDTMRAVFESLPGDGYFVQVPGMFHLDMTDAPFLTPLVAWPGLSGPIGGDRAHDIVNACSTAFFDRELRGRRAPLLDDPHARPPELILESR